jgi:hypothetical protein
MINVIIAHFKDVLRFLCPITTLLGDFLNDEVMPLPVI